MLINIRNRNLPIYEKNGFRPNSRKKIIKIKNSLNLMKSCTWVIFEVLINIRKRNLSITYKKNGLMANSRKKIHKNEKFVKGVTQIFRVKIYNLKNYFRQLIINVRV